MILMIQNFGSNPKMSCKTITEEVITIGFLYLVKKVFMVNNILIRECHMQPELFLIKRFSVSQPVYHNYP